jgi:hypothetical protein
MMSISSRKHLINSLPTYVAAMAGVVFGVLVYGMALYLVVKIIIFLWAW